MMECPVCTKHKTLETLPGGAIFQDERVFIAHFPHLKDEPAHFGHVIIETKRHIESARELSDVEATSIGLFLQRITRGLELGMGAEHVYVVRIGDKVPHLHFHLVPRFPGTPRDFWGPLLFQWPMGKKATPQEMVQITEKLKNYL
jgi:diadenosine tetraphosphate (Ap4A) HIT family hydrolase